MPQRKKNKPTAKVHAPESAVEARAKREGWNAGERASRCSRARALRTCRRHYRQVMPDHWQQMVNLIRVDIGQAVIDCLELDRCLKGRGEQVGYVENFAVFDVQPVLNALHVRAFARLKEMFQPKRSSPEWMALKSRGLLAGQAKLTIQRIKERLRDGHDMASALQWEDFSIKRMAVDGNVRFFKELGQVIQEQDAKPKRYEGRMFTTWVERAWLPLCLWECDADGHEAFERFLFAATILNRPEVNEKRFEDRFRDAWKNVRKRSMKDAVQLSKISAAASSKT